MNTPQTSHEHLFQSAEFQKIKKDLLQCIQSHTKNLTHIRGPLSDTYKQNHLDAVKQLSTLKGRDAYFPYLSSGIGNGPYVELLDGSVKLDFINGIGINFFGHSHPELMSELIDTVCSDTMQGNLQPSYESDLIIKEILKHTGKSQLKHAWLFCSGTMANETALKIIRQKKYPANGL